MDTQMTEARTVAVGCRKGGVGKSALVASLASVFAHEGRRVLIVDLDPQGNVTFGLGGEPGAPGTAEFLLGEAVEPTEIRESLHILAGGPELNGREISALDPDDLRDAVQSKKAEYDVILFDLPPYSELLERFGLVASDRALIPVVAHPFAISGATRIIELIDGRKKRRKLGPKHWALVLSMVDLRRSLDRQLTSTLGEFFPAIDRLSFRQDTAVSFSLTDQIPLMEYEPRARVINDLNRIAEWIDGKA